MSCPNEDTFVRFLEGTLPEASRESFLEHLDVCSVCRQLLSEMAKSSSAGDGVPVPDGADLQTKGDLPGKLTSHLERGSSVGRLVVLERLGEGGMGVVYAAYDPELDRRVAVKFVHGMGFGSRGEARARLLREAQAMARLVHPNVVAVHDVGTHRDQVYLVMELVKGMNLRDWLRETERPWREIVEVFRSAGEGLAAAHRAGLVHRDFKPANVLVAEDGRVQVTDFGLARPAEHRETEPQADHQDPESPATALSSPITRTGELVGTPAYMAPEQQKGQPADARSDQYSFCLSLYEALFGTRPAGEPQAATAPRGIPKLLRRALLRGLRAHPEERYPAMEPLLADLGRDRSRSRWRVVATGLAGLLILSIAAVWIFLGRDQPCPSAAYKLAGIWDSQRKASLRKAFLGAGLPHAEEAWSKVSRTVDAYARRWIEAADQNCAATWIHGEQSADLLDLRSLCLEQRRQEIVALADVLAEPDAEVIRKAAQASFRLGPLSACADKDALLQRVRQPADANQRRRIEVLQKELAEVKALRETGSYQRALERCTKLVEDVRAVGFAPLLAEALARKGDLQAQTGKLREADETLKAAVQIGLAARHHLLVVEAWIRRAHLAAENKTPEQGREFTRLADAMLSGLGPHGEMRAWLLHTQGIVLLELGRYDRALERYQQAAEARRGLLGDRHPSVALSLYGQARARMKQGAYQQAIDLYGQARAIFEDAYGRHHPKVAQTHRAVGVVLEGQGKYHEALASLERALAIQEATLGPEHPLLADTINSMAVVREQLGEPEKSLKLRQRALALVEAAHGADHRQAAAILAGIAVNYKTLGQHEESVAHFRRALAIKEKALGAEHPEVAFLLMAMATPLTLKKDFAEAEKILERALAIQEKTLKPDHPQLGETLTGFADLYYFKGEYAEALKYYRRILAMDEKTLGPDHGYIAYDLNGIGHAMLGMKDYAGAIEPLQRAVRIREKIKADAFELGESRFALARALRGAGRQSGRARTLVEQARAAFVAAGERGREQLAEADAWLAGDDRK